MLFIYEMRIKHRHADVYYYDNRLRVQVERASCSKLKYYASEADSRTCVRSLFPSARAHTSLSLSLSASARFSARTHLFTLAGYISLNGSRFSHYFIFIPLTVLLRIELHQNRLQYVVQRGK